MQDAPRRPNVRAPIPAPSQVGGRSPGSIQRAPAIQRIQQQPGAPGSPPSQPGPSFPQPQQQQPRQPNIPQQRPLTQPAQQRGLQQQPHAPQHAAQRAPTTASPHRASPMRPIGTMPVDMSPQPLPVQHAPASGMGQPRHDVHFDHRAQQPQPQVRGASQFPPPQARVSQFPPPQQPMPYPPQASPPYPPQGFSPMPPSVQQGPSSQGYGAPAQAYAPTPNPANVRYPQAPAGNRAFPAPNLPPHFAQQQQAVPSTARPSAFPGRRRSSAPPSESIAPVGPVEPQQILAASVFLGVPLVLATLVVAVLALRTEAPATDLEPGPAGTTVSPATSGPKKGAAAPASGPERWK